MKLNKNELKALLDEITELNSKNFDIAKVREMLIKDGITADGRFVEGVRLSIEFLKEKEEWETYELVEEEQLGSDLIETQFRVY